MCLYLNVFIASFSLGRIPDGASVSSACCTEDPGFDPQPNRYFVPKSWRLNVFVAPAKSGVYVNNPSGMKGVLDLLWILRAIFGVLG